MADNPNAQSVIDYALQFRLALERKDTVALNRLISAYRDIYSRLSGDIDALTLQIASGEYTATTVIKLDRYRDLIQQAAEQLRDFQGLTRAEIETAARLGLDLGSLQARQLLSVTARGDVSVTAAFRALPKETLEQLMGFLDPAGPLYQRLALLAPTTVDGISAAILEGVAKGYGPKVLAGRIVNELGMGLTDALRMTRTTQLYSYREASRATYMANAEVMEGWQWFAQLDGSTCMSCVAQHGSIHPVTETLNDHHNGRCAMLPITKFYGPPLDTEQGRKWFGEQSETMQRQMMGAGKFDAWQEGKFDLSQMTTEKPNDVWGLMKNETTLKELVGDD